MALSTLRTVTAVLMLAGALCVARDVHAVSASSDVQGREILDLIQEGRAALTADKPADALKLVEEAIAKPGFGAMPPELQYFAYLVGSYAAEGVDNNARAHELLLLATRFPDADAELWTRRARTAAPISAWDDAALSLTTVARKWPKQLKNDEYHSWLLGKTVRELGKQPKYHQLQNDLIDALFDAGYKGRYGIEPSNLWQIAATNALERKDVKRARDFARRITDSSTLVAMRIDKRFDALIAEDPKQFDVQAAAEREVRQAKSIMKDNPKSLNAAVVYGYSLQTVGHFDELLSLADGIIAKLDQASAKKPPYDDIDESLNWIHNHKATALRALGRWDEAAAVLAAWGRNEHNRDDKVSQAINLGFFYNEMGDADDALKAVAGLDSKDMSEYGATQVQYVRFQAYQQLGKKEEAQSVVTWMREHKADSLDTAQDTLLQAGDADGAAALFITRLADVNDRAAALASIQRYAPIPRTEPQKKLDALKETFLARADVMAAIDQYGRRETFPIYSLEY